MHGKEALESHGWSGPAPRSLIPPAKSSTGWPKGGNFQHLCGWHPCNASCFHSGELSVSPWDMVTLTTVVWRYYQLFHSLSPSPLPLSLTCFFLMQLFPAPFTSLPGCLLYCPLPLLMASFLRWEKENCIPGFGKRRKMAKILLQEHILLEQQFLLEHHEGITEFVSENTNTGKSIAELLFAITACHQHSWLMQSQDQFIWCPRQSSLPRLQETFSHSSRLHESEHQGTNPSYGRRVNSLWDLSEWGYVTLEWPAEGRKKSQTVGCEWVWTEIKAKMENLACGTEKKGVRGFK